MTKREDQRNALDAIAATLVVALLGGVTSVAAEVAVESNPEAVAEASAQSADDADLDDQDAGGRQAPGPLSKLNIHGFLTQAYATGSFQTGRFPNPDGSPAGPTLDEKVLGIPEDGTTDYRFLALQFRYEISPKDIMVIQFSSRALGDSPITDIEDEIDLDWAFYERRIGDNTSIKVGRVPIPFGIFNEIRDVGTILPFYRPAFSLYDDGSFTSETVDGVGFFHTFGAASDWSLDLNVYGGEWDLVEVDPFQEQAVEARAEDAYGAQLWLRTPVSGLRLGLGYQQRDVTGGLEGAIRVPGESTHFEDVLASAEAAFERFVFRAEVRFTESDPFEVPFLGVSDYLNEDESFYLQFGFHPTNEFRVYLQWENLDRSLTTALFTEPQDYTARVDYGIVLNYLFTPNLTLKAEYHMVEGEDAAFMPVFLPQPQFLQLQPIYSDLDDGDYTIISLSASF